MVERMRLDLVNELAWFGLGRHEIKPTARKKDAVAQIDQAPREDIESPEVVQQPSVDSRMRKRCLHRDQIEHAVYLCYGEIVHLSAIMGRASRTLPGVRRVRRLSNFARRRECEARQLRARCKNGDWLRVSRCLYPFL